MTAVPEVTVREAARRVGRSEETIRRWIWSGRLPAVKRGRGYRIDVRHLEEVIVEIEPGAVRHGTKKPLTMLEWLEAVAEWKRGFPTPPEPGASAADLVIEDRHARR